MMIKKLPILILSIPISILAYNDLDLDGVEDLQDKCPNSLITDLVDKDGCKIDSVEALHHFDIITGVKYTKIKSKTYRTSTSISVKTLKLDYYYKDFSFSVSSAKGDSIYDDTYISAKYSYKYNGFIKFTTSLNLILPTYKNYLNNNLTDYGVAQSVIYKENKLSLFGAYGYTVINDKDKKKFGLYYKNKNSYTLGIGYDIKPNFYTSISLSYIDSIYRNRNNTINKNLFLLYSIDDNWFSSISYLRVEADRYNSDATSFKIGYYY